MFLQIYLSKYFAWKKYFAGNRIWTQDLADFARAFSFLQVVASLQLITSPQLVACTLEDQAEVMKTTTLLTGSITQSITTSNRVGVQLLHLQLLTLRIMLIDSSFSTSSKIWLQPMPHIKQIQSLAV